MRKSLILGMIAAMAFGMNTAGWANDFVVRCQIDKIEAARARNGCLTEVQERKLKGFSLEKIAQQQRECEDRFDRGLAAADARAANQDAACRYVDNGDGTVSDLDTLLMWERKVPGASTSFDFVGVGNCLHCVEDSYNWQLAMSEWPSALNGRTDDPPGPDAYPWSAGFAGHSDWRLPNIVELQTILDCSHQPFCADPIFGAARSAGSNYWSSTSTLAQLSSTACAVDFFHGNVICMFNGKLNLDGVRAVRGGRTKCEQAVCIR